jgi:hypothetical protein
MPESEDPVFREIQAAFRAVAADIPDNLPYDDERSYIKRSAARAQNENSDLGTQILLSVEEGMQGGLSAAEAVAQYIEESKQIRARTRASIKASTR